MKLSQDMIGRVVTIEVHQITPKGVEPVNQTTTGVLSAYTKTAAITTALFGNDSQKFLIEEVVNQQGWGWGYEVTAAEDTPLVRTLQQMLNPNTGSGILSWNI